MTTESETGRCFEIEITPEMIARAGRALATFDTDYSSFEEGAEAVLTAAFSLAGSTTSLVFRLPE
jgi:hypothetical protein